MITVFEAINDIHEIPLGKCLVWLSACINHILENSYFWRFVWKTHVEVYVWPLGCYDAQGFVWEKTMFFMIRKTPPEWLLGCTGRCCVNKKIQGSQITEAVIFPQPSCNTHQRPPPLWCGCQRPSPRVLGSPPRRYTHQRGPSPLVRMSQAITQGFRVPAQALYTPGGPKSPDGLTLRKRDMITASQQVGLSGAPPR